MAAVIITMLPLAAGFAVFVALVGSVISAMFVFMFFIFVVPLGHLNDFRSARTALDKLRLIGGGQQAATQQKQP
ncbi:hypothetical protein [Sulfitobacter sp.]|uniref:hypothetical protein n=1 Tax=Sulfitobacter sp. TaxID=1903071 RepID=UPI00300244A5